MTALQPAGWLPALPLFLLTIPVCAQGQTLETPRTRAEAIAVERADKVAELWPERQSPLVDRANALAERGFKEGLDSGQGPNGVQLLLGGMRIGQGMTGGIGYRRSDFWQERLGLPGHGARHDPACLHDGLQSRFSGTSNSADIPPVVHEARELAAHRLLRVREQLVRRKPNELSVPRSHLRLQRGVRACSTPSSRGDRGLPSARTPEPVATRIRRSRISSPDGAAWVRGKHALHAYRRVRVRRFPRFADGSTKRRIVRSAVSGVLGRRSEGVRIPSVRVRVPAVPALLQQRPRAGGASGGRAVVSQEVTIRCPLYLQPSLGGNDDLRGFGRIPLPR